MLATLACQRPGKNGKRPDCICDPCTARRSIFGGNVPVQIQEVRRTRVTEGKLIDLKDGSLDDSPEA